MKRCLTSLLVICLFATLLSGCGKKASTLPPLGALSALPESRLSEAVTGYSRDSLVLGWGEPKRTMQGYLGDTWNLDETREITVLYDEYRNVFVVKVQDLQGASK